MTPNPEKWEETLAELLDKNFPKHECQERGRALVFYGEVTMLIRSLLTKKPLQKTGKEQILEIDEEGKVHEV